MHTNRLANEQSPYLQQHANNPVDWYPWGEEAFAKARAENKPIFLSVGYSTCHWCHVMERESFENEPTAEILNRDFVPIKVDREERPDVDRIYMLFVQATTGGGGWPMSVWLTPELKPFYGGTYFPPDNRYGRPGFRTVLTHLAQAWRDDREKIDGSVNEIMSQLGGYAALGAAAGVVDDKVLDSGYSHCRRTFDRKFGGFGGAPKFPRPVQLNFLLRYWKATGEEEALSMTVATLKAMAAGGMNDQLGGGFHRYSVDARWFVPHFEKMLYDQAQLAVSYLEAYQITNDAALATEARRIFDYVLRDMTHRLGGFFSAEDADSVIHPDHPHEKGEGAFYVFDWREIEAVLGPDEAKEFGRYFGCRPEGNVEPHEDPHEEFTRKNILFRAEEPAPAFAEARAKLLGYRNMRVRPHLDDKVLTSWNGLMISALAKGARILKEPRYMDAARRAAAFLQDTVWNAATKTLRRRWRAGESAIEGFLDDYAFFTLALLDLYETGFDKTHLDLAITLAERMRELFEDKEHGAFYSTAEGDPALVMRLKEDYDGAEPSGNSMAAMVLLRLAAMTGRADFAEAANRTIAAFHSRLTTQSAAVPQMLCAYLFAQRKPGQIQFTGSDPAKLIDAVHAKFLPFHVLLRSGMQDGPAEAQICENFVCRLPVSDPETLASQVE
ncbi:MAG: thioredoxin domain-containing protein [Acidobacteria bacterium]|nr:thioredoxin domain-containing protein [Acidobacteriota bacterium]